MPARGTPPLLSIPRVLAGLQCHKRLYFECFLPDLADPAYPAYQPVLDVRPLAAEIVRCLSCGSGTLDCDYLRHSGEDASDTGSLSHSSVPLIVDAAFQFDGIRIRVDLLTFDSDGSANLVLARQATGPREDHLTDAALQFYAVTGCGMMVRRVCLAKLRNQNVSGGGDHSVGELVSMEDITNEVLKMQAPIPPALEAMKLALHGLEPPDIKMSEHCLAPHICALHGHCHLAELEHPPSQLLER